MYRISVFSGHLGLMDIVGVSGGLQCHQIGQSVAWTQLSLYKQTAGSKARVAFTLSAPIPV